MLLPRTSSLIRRRNLHRTGFKSPTPEDGSDDLYARLSQLRSSTLRDRNLLGMHTIYLGESFLLTYVVRNSIDAEATPSSVSTLQLPLPTAASNKDRLRPDSHLSEEDLEVLRLRNAFTLPEKEACDALVATFFQIVYPAFPIFDRRDFALLYETNQISLLVLNSIFALASTLCDAKVLKMAGFDCRRSARKTFLKRTKALYDADYDRDKVSLIQATFIISFLWDGANDAKDMWHWLGIAISIAQTKGLHRSTRHSILRLRDRKLWKRLWWSLYVRDRHCAGTVGRPLRIRDDDCDVEPLDETDFIDADDDEFGDSDPVVRSSVCTRINVNFAHIQYTISMSRLTVIFGNIISSKFPISPSRDTLSSAELVEHLKIWRQQLLLRVSDDDEDQNTWFWARMLDLSYNHLLILLHRPEHGKVPGTVISPHHKALMAANRISRIVDEFLGMGAMQQTQLQM
ncbi:uncharacterized protein A1O5_10051 [Cladophialophora psammophila CBS 110553]|uniref:Xylanolytic transcriptional activator regulatory domain-containing protein n=1 Tax=Cladophialophora psammophila CBS 110553 TaxID=1182543 RepID=W9WQE5_9EURO|nr:uncharacterized protein A1O5_10051 [Cladophialophora psammophila CBS 110553]EXJ66856.1 hypothetical protein A1O5_10051 [Cladophialophora psammophila CBS 110553]